MTKIPRVFEIMKERGITAKKLADAVGVSQGNVSDWKSGRSAPTATVMVKIADFLGVSADQLLGREMPHAVTDEELMFALFDGTEGVTDAMYEEVKQFARFVKQREAYKNDV